MALAELSELLTREVRELVKTQLVDVNMLGLKWVFARWVA